MPHNLQVNRQGNVYVADRTNRRIQVFDTEGNFKRVIMLNVAYDKNRHPVLGNLTPNRPDNTAPWTLCISQGQTQYLYTTDDEPGRLYKLTLDGKILGSSAIRQQPGQLQLGPRPCLPIGRRDLRRRHEQLASGQAGAAGR